MQIAVCVLLESGRFGGIISKILACISDYGANSILPFAIAISLFQGCRKLRIRRGRKGLKVVGAATLGIYLFHDNVNFRGLLWQSVYNAVSNNGDSTFIFSAIISVISVFVLGCAVELARSFITKKLLNIAKSMQLR